jgi:hypothetical protein
MLMLSQPLPILDRRGCGVFGTPFMSHRGRSFIFVFDTGSIVRRAGMGIMQFLFI